MLLCWKGGQALFPFSSLCCSVHEHNTAWCPLSVRLLTFLSHVREVASCCSQPSSSSGGLWGSSHGEQSALAPFVQRVQVWAFLKLPKKAWMFQSSFSQTVRFGWRQWALVEAQPTSLWLVVLPYGASVTVTQQSLGRPPAAALASSYQLWLGQHARKAFGNKAASLWTQTGLWKSLFSNLSSESWTCYWGYNPVRVLPQWPGKSRVGGHLLCVLYPIASFWNIFFFF